MSKNIIILGAGASVGAGKAGFSWNHSPLKEKCPALGNQLLADLKIFNPDGWGAVPKNISDLFQDDFESGMVEYVKHYPTNLSVLQRAMAAYFFSFTAKMNNLYVKLGQKIKNSQWQGTLITLNYERLLEQSLLHVGLKLVCNSIPQDKEQIELCFPHGCCHLFCEGISGTPGVIFTPGVCTSGSVKVISNPQEFNNQIINNVFPPIMSYFEPNKTTTSGVNFIDSQRKRFKTLVSEAEQIVIIGIRVRPHDKHLWEPLAETKGKIMYCAGDSGIEYEQWALNSRKDNHDITLNKFFDHSSFDELCNHVNL